MASILNLRDGLAVRLQTITGLRTAETTPPDPKPPIAIPMFPSVEFNKSGALDEYQFTIVLIVGKVVDRTAERLMAAYCARSGTSSIKAAIEADKTLAGAASDLRVTDIRPPRALSISENTYLAAEILVTVYAR